MKTESLKAAFLSVLAFGLLLVNIILPAKTITSNEGQPQAIFAAVATGGSLAAVADAVGAGMLSGLSTEVEELAPAFALAGSGATMAEVLVCLGEILAVGAGIGVLLAIAG